MPNSPVPPGVRAHPEGRQLQSCGHLASGSSCTSSCRNAKLDGHTRLTSYPNEKPNNWSYLRQSISSDFG